MLFKLRDWNFAPQKFVVLGESEKIFAFRDQSLLMVGGGAEDIKGGSPIIFLPRWGGQIKNQTARGGAMKNNQLKLTSILFRNK